MNNAKRIYFLYLSMYIYQSLKSCFIFFSKNLPFHLRIHPLTTTSIEQYPQLLHTNQPVLYNSGLKNTSLLGESRQKRSIAVFCQWRKTAEKPLLSSAETRTAIYAGPRESNVHYRPVRAYTRL